jgi:site-specific DNA-cytosine methylase
LTTTALLSTFSSLTGDISLISEKDLHWLGHVDLVIAGWPCQGMSMAGNQNGL